MLASLNHKITIKLHCCNKAKETNFNFTEQSHYYKLFSNNTQGTLKLLSLLHRKHEFMQLGQNKKQIYDHYIFACAFLHLTQDVLMVFSIHSNNTNGDDDSENVSTSGMSNQKPYWASNK